MPGGMARDRRSEARKDRSFSPVAFFFDARIPGKIAPTSTEGDTSHKNAARSHKPHGATSFPTSCEAHKSYHPEIPHHIFQPSNPQPPARPLRAILAVVLDPNKKRRPVPTGESHHWPRRTNVWRGVTSPARGLPSIIKSMCKVLVEMRGLASLTANACFLAKERRTPFCKPMPALTD